MMGYDGFDHFGDDDFSYDDDLSLDLRLPPQLTVLPGTGHIKLVGQAILAGPATLSASGTSTAAPKIVEPLDPPETLFDLPTSEEPAGLLWTPIARLILSPSRYRAEWLSHVSDMNYERHECLKRGDVSGARWAVLRAHFYSLPRWLLLIPGGFLLHLLRRWLGF